MNHHESKPKQPEKAAKTKTSMSNMARKNATPLDSQFAANLGVFAPPRAKSSLVLGAVVILFAAEGYLRKAAREVAAGAKDVSLASCT